VNVPTYQSGQVVRLEIYASKQEAFRGRGAAGLGTEPRLSTQRRGQTPQTAGNPRTITSGAGYTICRAFVAVGGL